MNTDEIIISFVIPTYNSAATIINTLESITKSTRLKHEIIIVDDKSTDKTVATVEAYHADNLHSEIILHQLAQNSGPGVARNVGFQLIRGKYTIFFDSDDQLMNDVIDHAIKDMDDDNVDVGFFAYKIKSTNLKYSGGMWPDDKKIFSQYLDAGSAVFSIVHYPLLLCFTNYPWNKILRTGFLHDMHFRFSQLRLHEDILPHWSILISAQKIKLFDQVICEYYLNDSGKNVTNDKSILRIQCIDAIAELYDYLGEDSRRALYLPVFRDFSKGLISWAEKNIDKKYRKQFNAKLLQISSILS